MKPITCTQTLPLLGAYVDGELNVATRQAIEAHLASCPSCAGAREANVALQTALAKAKPRLYRPAPAGLTSRIRAAIIGGQVPTGSTANPASTPAPSAALNGSAHPALKPRAPQPFDSGGSVSSAMPTDQRQTAGQALPSVAVPLFVEAQPSSRAPRRWLRPVMSAAATIALVGAGWMIHRAMNAAALQRAAREFVDSHDRSVETKHLVDLDSSDPQTVKAWFSGKLDFTPDVRELTIRGYPLVGGRIETLGGQTVAVLVYRRGEHAIEIFTLRTQSTAPAGLKQLQQGDYQIATWTAGGMTYWIVSDVSDAELHSFAGMNGAPVEDCH